MNKIKDKEKNEILIYCPFIERGGIKTTLIKYSEFLSKKFTIKIFTEKFDRKTFYNFSKNVSIYESKIAKKFKNRIMKDILIFWMLKKFANKNSVIFSMHDHIVPLVINKFLGKNKLVIRTAGIIPNQVNYEEYQHLKNIILKRILIRFYKLADKVITFSLNNVRYFKNININAVCIYNNFEKQKKIKNFKNKRKLNIFFVGRFSYEKDPIFFLKNLISEKNINIHLVGDGEDKARLKKISQGKKNVIFHGFVKNPFKKFLNTMDLLCITSKFDGTPNVMGEAMSFGIPVLAPKNVGLANLFIANSKYGFLYNSGDAVSFKSKINFIMKNYDLAKNKAKKAYLNLKRFNEKNTHLKLIKELNKL